MRKLGELEAVIMDRVWSRPHPVTVRELVDELNERRRIAYTTVMTVMDNLHRKGWLQRDRTGRAYSYRAVASREDHIARVMRDALGSSRDLDATLVRFLDAMTDEEAGALRRALADRGGIDR